MIFGLWFSKNRFFCKTWHKNSIRWSGPVQILATSRLTYTLFDLSEKDGKGSECRIINFWNLFGFSGFSNLVEVYRHWEGVSKPPRVQSELQHLAQGVAKQRHVCIWRLHVTSGYSPLPGPLVQELSQNHSELQSIFQVSIW